MNNILAWNFAFDVSKNFFQGTVVEAREINGGEKCMEFGREFGNECRSFLLGRSEKFSTEFFFYIDTNENYSRSLSFSIIPPPPFLLNIFQLNDYFSP